MASTELIEIKTTVTRETRPASMKLEEGKAYEMYHPQIGIYTAEILKIRVVNGIYLITWKRKKEGDRMFETSWITDTQPLDFFKRDLLDLGSVRSISLEPEYDKAEDDLKAE